MSWLLDNGLAAVSQPRPPRTLRATVLAPRTPDAKPVVAISHEHDLLHDLVIGVSGVAVGVALASFVWWRRDRHH